MRKFETLLLLSPELSTEVRTALIDGFKAVIEREGGKLLQEDNWGMRDLAYPVKKQMRGWYVRLEYAAPGALVAELERNIRIAEGVFKFLTVKLVDDAEEVPA
jgi:small subunit ribosomal protein S6